MAPNYLKLAAPYVGVPYKLHGRDPAAWDCRGCVAYLRRLLFGKDGPSMEGVVSVEAAAKPSLLAAEMERLVKAQLSDWRPVAAAPGAVPLLEVFGRAAHVGLLLDHVHFIHAMPGCETVISRLDEPRWHNRVRGIFDG